MTKLKRIPQEIIDEAKEVDLIDFCNRNGIPLIDEDTNNPKLAEHDSLVFFRGKTDRQWHRFSTNEGGNSIDFVEFYYPNIEFRKAVSLLMNENIETLTELDLQRKSQKKDKVKEINRKPFKYNNYEVRGFSIAKNYLVNERGLSEKLIDILHSIGCIRQDARDNVVFKWYDVLNGGKHVGANMQGTDKNVEGRSYKLTHENSTHGKGFNLLCGKPKNVKFFESSIDMLSYIDLNRLNLRGNWLISMEGLKGTVLRETIKDLEKLEGKDEGFKVDTITFCVDNDEKGKDFINKHIKDKELYKGLENPRMEVDIPKYTGDWNDELKYFKNEKQQEKIYAIDYSYEM